jgi:hypothetical protein
VPAGRPPFLRHHRSRRTRTRRRPEPRVRACAARAFQHGDLLRHDHQPGRRARAGREAARRDTAALRPRAPGEPVNPARHADDPPRSRAGSRQSRSKRTAPQTCPDQIRMRPGRCPCLTESGSPRRDLGGFSMNLVLGKRAARRDTAQSGLGWVLRFACVLFRCLVGRTIKTTGHPVTFALVRCRAGGPG